MIASVITIASSLTRGRWAGLQVGPRLVGQLVERAWGDFWGPMSAELVRRRFSEVDVLPLWASASPGFCLSGGAVVDHPQAAVAVDGLRRAADAPRASRRRYKIGYHIANSISYNVIQYNAITYIYIYIYTYIYIYI